MELFLLFAFGSGIAAVYRTEPKILHQRRGAWFLEILNSQPFLTRKSQYFYILHTRLEGLGDDLGENIGREESLGVILVFWMTEGDMIRNDLLLASLTFYMVKEACAVKTCASS